MTTPRRLRWLPLTSLLALVLFSPRASADPPQVGIGAMVKQGADGVEVTQVFLGAKHAGIQKGDLLIAADGKPITERRQAAQVLRGDACSMVDVTVQRGSNRATLGVWRIPMRGGGPCVGVYQFKTPTQSNSRRWLDVRRSVRALLEKATTDSSKLSALTDQSAVDSTLDLDAYFGGIKTAYGVDLSGLKTHTDEVLEHLHKTMPEGQGGTWRIVQIDLRVSDAKNDVGVHTDSGDRVAVFTTLLGRPTRYHPMGCLGAKKNDELRSGRSGHTLVIQNGRRFDAWSGVRPRDLPKPLRELRARCRDKPVPHAAPENQRGRVILVLQVAFERKS